jgi:hypothetical protein
MLPLVLGHPDPGHQNPAGLATSSCPQRFLLSPKWSILGMQNQHIGILYSCRETHRRVMYTTSNDYIDHYISFIGLRIHEKK